MHQKGLGIDKAVSRLGHDVTVIDEHGSVFDSYKKNNAHGLKQPSLNIDTASASQITSPSNNYGNYQRLQVPGK